MTVLFSAAWAGTVYIEDMNLGVMDRMLASPVRRGAMINGTIAYQSITSGRADRRSSSSSRMPPGARFQSPGVGIVLTFVGAVLLTVVFAALSNASPCSPGTQDALIGISQLLALPLAFLSSAIMNPTLAPDWVQTVGHLQSPRLGRRGQPRSPLRDAGLGCIWPRLGALAVLAVVMSWLATKAFALYQRST